MFVRVVFVVIVHATVALAFKTRRKSALHVAFALALHGPYNVAAYVGKIAVETVGKLAKKWPLQVACWYVNTSNVNLQPSNLLVLVRLFWVRCVTMSQGRDSVTCRFAGFYGCG